LFDQETHDGYRLGGMYREARLLIALDEQCEQFDGIGIGPGRMI
jgi:hypothetical protein